MMHIEKKGRAAVLALLFIALLGCLFWAQFRVAQSKTLPVEPGAVLIGAAEAPQVPPEAVAVAKKRLASAPLDQRALNLLFVDAVRNEAPAAQVNKVLQLLQQVSWRYTAAQQNIIAHAVGERNFRAIVENSDALLRREQASTEIIQLLHLIEVEPETQEYLVAQLGHNPPWLENFFAETRFLQTEAQVIARSRTLAKMFEVNQAIERNNLAPSLNAMIEAGQFLAARRLYQEFAGEAGPEIVSDPEFIKLAAAREIPGYRPFPFEWAIVNDRGLQVSAVESIGNATVTVRWNGRGTPLMMRQVIILDTEQDYVLELTGLDATADLLRTVNFQLLCPEGVTNFEFENYDPKTKIMRLATNDATPCEFPKLDVRGKVQEISRPREFSLSSLYIRAVR